ncbi:hypothetical protein EYR41_000607 [Orbilia oligospora]|uniref:Uncharacterized protein n=1 Tax=Orbilia oligospora TaxID=2813651 RepID=A0A7C8PDY2_ORBOL|nr:hypothetical protein TWF751_005812 [Orbilia oligospora]KAF3287964.1 hypothetical protein TWF132_008085 [Orbilia oligospora]TGJ73519.1 hypothetical protein EYR41_000607 [Orbilia oligospora]
MILSSHQTTNRNRPAIRCQNFHRQCGTIVSNNQSFLATGRNRHRQGKSQGTDRKGSLDPPISKPYKKLIEDLGGKSVQEPRFEISENIKRITSKNLYPAENPTVVAHYNP